MSQVPILTGELARRIEALVAPEISAPKATRDPTASTVVRFGRTIASKARSGRPANKVFCFGHEDLARLGEILAFYAIDNLEPSFFLAPTGFTGEVAAALTAAGFSQRDFRQAILYGPPRPASAQLPSGVTIERVTAANLDPFVYTTAEGFEWPAQWRDAAMADMRRNFQPEKHHFLARFQGQPAGVGSIGIREGVASLTGGSVIPNFRRNGIHLALINHRLTIAYTLGCTLILGGAVFGSGSFRNQQRAGLRIAYIESGWHRR